MGAAVPGVREILAQMHLSFPARPTIPLPCDRGAQEARPLWRPPPPGPSDAGQSPGGLLAEPMPPRPPRTTTAHPGEAGASATHAGPRAPGEACSCRL